MTTAAEPTKPFDGAKLFNLKATHGMPLEVCLDRIINENKLVVDWPAFIDEARRNKWWDFQTLPVIQHGLIDADVPREMRANIEARVKLYMLAHLHPGLAEEHP